MKLWVAFLFTVDFCNGAKVLGVFNHPGASHTFLGKVLLKTLAQNGHEVVMISSFPMTESVPNYKDIYLSDNLKDLQRRNDKKGSNGMGLQETLNMTLEHTENTFTNPQVKELLQSHESFDLIIIDWFFNEATLIFGHIYKAPVIYLSSFGNMALLNEFTGNVLPFSYVPGAGLFASDEMSFKHRTVMTLFNIVYNALVPRRNSAHHNILKRHFDNPPTIEELKNNIALVLSNSHFSFETPRLYSPNIIPIGGFHIQETKELPQDLKEFLDNAKEGVIYFSLGSQLKSTNFNKNIFSHIVRALGRVQLKILWKIEIDDVSQIPKNIKTVKWVPQTEVLAHPNLKLFITHGGMLSLVEAIYYHVPLICLPFNGDQLTNAAFVESREIGLHIFPDNITEDLLFNMMDEIVANPKYQQQMNYRSSLLREQSVKPLDAAIYWVEHVIKHRTGDHLKTFATKLPWYKYYLLDVIGFLFLVLFIITTILLYVLKQICGKIYSLFSKTRKPKRE